ncbi:PAS domain-containing protein [Methylobacterium sp. E-005]|uniref:CheR family methyltransferase n=1 Tax=Methylobacterium sp. E-005 TaxID=2836549 RepID=UPI001FB883FB|nr:CheR family methyltransferase [Methylobacterium sp. E-005]MCJ2087404.1 PAS domain-containing protein [Methylobacterium sp. E-005]
MMTHDPFPIVGIGASAGGIEAMRSFFAGLPKPFGAAVIVITHLSPDRESLLPEVLARFTTLPVEAAKDATPVQPDRVYVMPPGVMFGIHQGRLTLTSLQPGSRETKPIDVFLTALALDQGERAVAVILSGGDSDGAIGVKAIKEHGGLTFAQASDENGPETPEMPVSALRTGYVDYHAAADEIGALIAKHSVKRTRIETSVNDDPNGVEVSADVLAEIHSILLRQVGHDFSGYKHTTFQRRLARRIVVGNHDGPDDYLARLRTDATEAAALFRDLLIGVTKFFRDVDAFDALAKLVIPKLFEGRAAEDVVRVWIPACSTGEEVYSIAILLLEHMATLPNRPRVQIFATDIDERSLTVARIGRYPRAYLDTISAERLARYFVVEGDSVVVAKVVRDLCTFAPHSVLRDPPFSRLDLISCRNLMIYLGLDAQERMLPTLHYALRPNGYLFIGMAENVTRFEDLFATVDKSHRIFQTTSMARSVRLSTMSADPWPGLAPGARTKPQGALAHASLRHIVDAEVLAKFAPPHAVVTRVGEAVHYSARIDTVLGVAPGLPTHELAALVAKGLRLELRTALREAIETNTVVARTGLEINLANGLRQPLALTVSPMASRPGTEPLFLVVFTETAPAANREGAASQAEIGRDETVQRLERELSLTRERLQAIVEEYETALEEVKSSNEELYSVNEEMQSGNEELEASKEEVQSINEELHTVNNELSSKIQALDRLAAEQKALFASTDIASVFLDRDLRIRTITDAAAQIFGIQAGDRGRLLTNFAAPFSLSWLSEDAQAVMASGRTADRLLDGTDGNRHRIRITASKIEGDMSGVIVNFVRVEGDAL